MAREQFGREAMQGRDGPGVGEAGLVDQVLRFAEPFAVVLGSGRPQADVTGGEPRSLGVEMGGSLRQRRRCRLRPPGHRLDLGREGETLGPQILVLDLVGIGADLGQRSFGLLEGRPGLRFDNGQQQHPHVPVGVRCPPESVQGLRQNPADIRAATEQQPRRGRMCLGPGPFEDLTAGVVMVAQPGEHGVGLVHRRGGPQRGHGIVGSAGVGVHARQRSVEPRDRQIVTEGLIGGPPAPEFVFRAVELAQLRVRFADQARAFGTLDRPVEADHHLTQNGQRVANQGAVVRIQRELRTCLRVRVGAIEVAEPLVSLCHGAKDADRFGDSSLLCEGSGGVCGIVQCAGPDQSHCPGE
ncbi:hypothetical protein ACWEKT_13410 [Nocardia takedensis]